MQKALTLKPHPPKGFTKLEVIIVLVIIAILITIALPSYQSYSDRAKYYSNLKPIALLVENEYLENSNRAKMGLAPEDFPYTSEQWVMRLNDKFPEHAFANIDEAHKSSQILVSMTESGEVSLTAPTGISVIAGAPVRNVIPVHYATNRVMTEPTTEGSWSFGGEWQNEMNYGVANVSIPPDHQRGALERPYQWWFMKFDENPEKHVVISGPLQKMQSDHFFSELAGDSDRPLLFIHGFNVVFEDAIRRTAQLAYDLSVTGNILSFSWPSYGGVGNYLADLNNNERSIPQLRKFLVDLKTNSGIEEINVIAHSMGNQVFTKALASLEDNAEVPRMNQVILAAPDIDRFVFEQEIASRLQRVHPERVTLYASTKDKALSTSGQLWSGERAGYISAAGIVTAGGIDSIDVSRVEAGWMSYIDLNHSAYGDELIDDMFLLLRHGHSPTDRNLLESNNGKFWIIPR